MKKQYETKDYHQELTDKILKSMIECDASGWEKPWIVGKRLPLNMVSGLPYHGVNTLALMSEGYEDPRFLTYLQIQQLSKSEDKPMTIKKGSKGIPVFKAFQVTFGGNEKPEPGEDVKPGGMMWRLKYAGTVFNASQVEGIEPFVVRENKVIGNDEVIALGQALTARTGLKIVHSDKGRAYYSVSEHAIHMPNQEKFKTSDGYYATLLHEKGHSTGPALGRKMEGVFGSAAYAFEELVAELTTRFMGAELGVNYQSESHDNAAQYLKGWIKALQDDKNYIFKAASQASKATEFQLEHLKEFRLEQAQSMSMTMIKTIEKQKVFIPPVVKKSVTMTM